jgi:hypothetical protein
VTAARGNKNLFTDAHSDYVTSSNARTKAIAGVQGLGSNIITINTPREDGKDVLFFDICLQLPA